MYCMRACLTGGHVLQEYMYNEWICAIKIHELKLDMPTSSTYRQVL